VTITMKRLVSVGYVESLEMGLLITICVLGGGFFVFTVLDAIFSIKQWKFCIDRDLPHPFLLDQDRYRRRRIKKVKKRVEGEINHSL